MTHYSENFKHPIPLILFCISWLALCLYSYSQKDLNLTIFNYPGFKELQDWMVWLGYYHRAWSMLLYGLILGGLFSSYYWLVNTLTWIKSKNLILIASFLIVSGLLAYPLFSHDIFNYLFNAKMVLVYGANPHIQTALEYASDPWVRFMHNIHTPAPYAYGWTALSLVPVYFTVSSFTVSLWMMKLLIIGFWILEGCLMYRISLKLFPTQKWLRTGMFLFNPLILTETFIVGHNDSVMMALALLAILLVIQYDEHRRPLPLGLALGALVASVAIKYATIILLPLFWLRKKVDVYTIGGLGLVMVLLTRPDQVHSWYLHWGIVLLLLSKYRWAVNLAMILSVTGLLRYLPFVYYGNWDWPVTLWRWALLVLPISIWLIQLLIARNDETRMTNDK